MSSSPFERRQDFNRAEGFALAAMHKRVVKEVRQDWELEIYRVRLIFVSLKYSKTESVDIVGKSGVQEGTASVRAKLALTTKTGSVCPNLCAGSLLH